jgi:micrococcal nuclease
VIRILVAILLGACGEATSPCGPAEATVSRVIDGDTIVLTSGVRIRYLLVNTPETTNGHHDCYGADATRANAALVEGQHVELGYDVACTDRYGRTLAYVAAAGVDVNAYLIERGYACLLHIPPDGDARAAEFKQLEAEAKAARRGLWGACDPIPCD